MLTSGLRKMKFTSDQTQAITSKSSRIKVLAVAGAGKTTVLTERIRHLIGKGVPPEEILVMTFTNRMAMELKKKAKNIKYVGTFHAMCLRLIEGHCNAIGYPRISLIGDEERKVIFKNIIDSNYLKFKNQKTLQKYLSDFYTYGKNPLDHNFGLFKKIYFRFMKKAGLADYDLLEYLTKKVIYLLEGKFSHIIVDEYQDTSVIEKQIIDGLESENVFVVGDVFQNIYSFRGTTIKNLMEFEADEIIPLAQTFRCTSQISDFANSIIGLSGIDYPYKVISDKSGGSVEVIESKDVLAELKRVIDKYLKLFDPADIFVLNRTNSQIYDIKEYLPDYDIENVQGAVKTSLSMARFTAFLNMEINLYHDYGVERFLRLMDLANRDAINHWKVTARRERKKLFSAVVEEMPILDQWRQLGKRDISLFLKAHSLLSGERADQDNIPLVLDMVELYEEMNGSDPEEFVKWIADGGEIDKESDKMRIMTIHAAKGLENKVVIIPNVEDGTFPNARASIEEELRLMYVASTRASMKLIIIKSGDSIFCGGKE